MHKFCTKCGHMLNTDGTCPNCGYSTKDSESPTNNEGNKKDSWFKVPNEMDLGMVEPKGSTKEEPITSKPPIKPTPPKPPIKPTKKPIPAKPRISPKQKKITIIIAACVLVVTVVTGVLIWLFSGKTGDTAPSIQNNETIQEKYLAEFGSYATVEGYGLETNEFGEKIVAADVSCPNYREIYSAVYEEISFNDSKTNEQIDKIFFEEVSKQLKNSDDYVFVMVEVNLSKEDYEKSENDSWTDKEIKEVVSRYVATSEFEEFCLDIIAEYTPEITEEGLLGE